MALNWQREVPLQWAHVVMIAFAVPPQWRPAPHPTARADAAKALKLGHYPRLVDRTVALAATKGYVFTAFSRLGRYLMRLPRES
jgi:hypothetical protein